ncbi:unnamed protein product [Soboliphyme baturini]|uniref:FERM domain-containing protein n=1 Tax=Soboliphyme baturini TaxID=241478 RepID=A0A183IPE6_9BILA|nr:unnamed protein product [Soboliphyme baturini]
MIQPYRSRCRFVKITGRAGAVICVDVVEEAVEFNRRPIALFCTCVMCCTQCTCLSSTFNWILVAWLAHAMARECNPSVRSLSKKVSSSPVVVVARLTGIQPRYHVQTPMQLATFLVDKCYKGCDELGEGLSVSLGLFKGHEQLSERTWCLSALFLDHHSKYMLFLDPFGVDTRRFTARYKAEKWSTLVQKKITRIMKRSKYYDGRCPPVTAA